jgi:hypothetical protein
LLRLCKRELITFVSEAQYTQTMTTCCHTAVQNASGKPFLNSGELKIAPVVRVLLGL